MEEIDFFLAFLASSPHPIVQYALYTQCWGHLHQYSVFLLDTFHLTNGEICTGTQKMFTSPSLKNKSQW